MAIISANDLTINTKYYENKIKLKVIHFCPLDGQSNDVNSKRIVLTTDASQPSADRYLLIVFYGPFAKTPFKKSALKTGQLFTLHRFETDATPVKNKVFKCSGQILKNFYEPLVLVKPLFEPIIKMLVSLREESTVAILENDVVIRSNQSTEQIEDNIERVSPFKSNESIASRSPEFENPAKKRLKFESNDDPIAMDFSSDEDFDSDLNRRRRRKSKSKRTDDNITAKNNNEVLETPKETNNNRVANNSNNSSNSPQSLPKYEYKNLIEVHKLMPVSGKTYCNIYGVLRYRDYKKNIIHLRDEKAYTFSVSLRPGNSTLRNYPAFRPGDILRIHRILLAPNTMDVICTDPKDVVVFEGFQDSESFSPIKASIRPTFEDFDKQRKHGLEEWFSDELLNDSLSEKTANTYTTYSDLAVQVLRVTTTRDRSYIEVWDTTRPALPTYKSQVSTDGLNLTEGEEELIRIVNENEMSIIVTVFEQHSNDAQSLKPFDFIVLFNVSIKADYIHKTCFTYSLNSSYNFGKCIRFVKPNSNLGKKLYSKIDEYKVMSAVNVPQYLSADTFPSQSEIDVNENEREIIESGDEDQQNIISDNEMPEDFPIDLNEVIDILDAEQSFLPAFHLVDIPDKSVFLNEITSNPVDKQLYKVKARVVNYLPSNEKIDIISVLCTNSDCYRIVTLRKAICEDPLIESILETSKDKKLILNCFKCKRSSGVLVFKLIFLMDDVKHNKLTAQLFGHNAELFFNATPEEVLQNEAKWHYVEQALNYICAKMASIDSKDSINVLNYWVLQPSKVEGRDHFIFQIRTAVAIETEDKCVGVNLN